MGADGEEHWEQVVKESGGELASWPFFRGMLRPLELGNWDLCSLKLLTSHLQCLALGRWYWPGGPILACLLWAVNSVSTMLSPLHSAHVEAHGSINPSLWHLALLGKGRLFVTNVRFFFGFFFEQLPCCSVGSDLPAKEPTYSPSAPMVCRNNWLCLFEFVFIQGRETFV